MATRKPISLERHKQLGRELFLIREVLLRLTGEISRHYSPRKKHGKAAAKSLKAVDSLRALMDSDVAALVDQQQWDNEKLCNVYYPGGLSSLAHEADARFEGQLETVESV